MENKKLFKKGDIIRGKKNNGYNVTNENMLEGEVLDVYINNAGFENMDVRVKKTLDGRFINSEFFYLGNSFERFELVKSAIKKNPVIVIRRVGNTVVAENKSAGKIGAAKCHPDDEFDFDLGAIIAFSRLMGIEISDSGKVCDSDVNEACFSGKVVCYKSKTRAFTEGKIYKFENGKTTTDHGHEYPVKGKIVSLEHLNGLYDSSRFVELVD